MSFNFPWRYHTPAGGDIFRAVSPHQQVSSFNDLASDNADEDWPELKLHHLQFYLLQDEMWLAQDLHTYSAFL